MAADFGGRVSQVEETEWRSENEKGGWEDDEDGLLECQGEVEAVTAAVADDGPKGFVSGKGTEIFRVVEIHIGDESCRRET